MLNFLAPRDLGCGMSCRRRIQIRVLIGKINTSQNLGLLEHTGTREVMCLWASVVENGDHRAEYSPVRDLVRVPRTNLSMDRYSNPHSVTSATLYKAVWQSLKNSWISWLPYDYSLCIGPVTFLPDLNKTFHVGSPVAEQTNLAADPSLMFMSAVLCLSEISGGTTTSKFAT